MRVGEAKHLKLKKEFTLTQSRLLLSYCQKTLLKKNYPFTILTLYINEILFINWVPL